MRLKVLSMVSGVVFLLGMLLVFPVWAKKSGQGQEGVSAVQEKVVIQEGVTTGKTPPGHSKGQKKGWDKHGTVMPPGQQKNLLEDGKYPKGLKKPQ